MISIVIMILILEFIIYNKLIMADYSPIVNDDKPNMKVVVDIIYRIISEMPQFE